MRILLFTTALILSAPAFAADKDNTITIIQDDGSKVVLDLGASAPPPAPRAPAPAPRVVPEPPPPIPQPRLPKGYEAAIVAPPPADESPEKLEQKPAPKKKKTVKSKPSKLAPKFKPRQAPAGAEITPALAMSIAIDHAPPSSDMNVFRYEYDGQPAYAVVFKTEEGFEEVLVHTETGKVLKVRPSEYFDAQPKPGHLPGTLR